MKSRTALRVAICLLCLIGVFLLPNKTKAAECDGFIYEVHEGEATITGCTLSYNYYMDIPATLDGYPVVAIGASAFQDYTDLMEVTVPEGVKTIGDYAFYQCYNLTWLDLPNSLESIGEKAFCNCKRLEAVDFGYGIKTIGDGAFSFCKQLGFSIYFPNTLETIGMGAFYDCDSLETVLLPNSLKDLGSKAFAMCARLDYVYIPDGVTRVGSQVLYQSACYYYSSNWYGDAFYVGSYLLEARKTISGNYKTLSGITNIADGAFENCNNLTGITLPDSLRIIGTSAFESCDKLQSIVIPSGVTTIGDRAFYECKAATDIQVPDSVEYLGQDAFGKTGYYDNAENWENGAFYVGDTLLSCNASVSGVFQVRQGTKHIADGAMKGLTKLTELILPDTVTTIGDEAFADCKALTKITIADGVTSIGEKAFYNCKALKTVYLGKNVSQIGDGAFGQCPSLESLTVSSDNGTYSGQNNCLIRIQDKCLVMGCKTSQIPQNGSVTSIGAFAFEGCAGLTEITIPDTILTIGEGAFRDCNALKSVSLGNGVQIVGKRAFEDCDVLSQLDLGQSVHTIDDYGFAYNHQITHVEFPASLRYLGVEAFSNATGLVSLSFQEGLVSIGENCFYFCDNLTSLHLPDSLEEIKGGAFYGCEKIETLHLGQELRTIGSAAFMGCEALKELVIPDKVQTIGSAAFYECTSLQHVDLGQVKKIEYSAFGACSSLTEIYIPASVTDLDKQVFSYCPAIEKMTVSPENPYYHSQGNCIIRTDSKILISGCKNSIIPADGSVTTLQAYAFAGCTTLKSIVVPDQVTSIYPYTFYECYGLESIQLPFIGSDKESSNHLNNGNYLGKIFGASSSALNDPYVPASLKKVVVTGGTIVDTSAFTNCYGIEEIVLPESVTTISYSAFSGCGQLKRLVLPGNIQVLKDTNIFGGTPNVTVYISAGRDDTLAMVQSLGVPYKTGGTITFLDEENQVIDQVWYALDATISTPAVPIKPADEFYSYEISWEPVPGICTGNQTIQLRYIAHWIGTHIPGDLNMDDKINSLDGLLLMRYLNGWDVDIAVPEAMDVNSDGKVNSLDGLILIRYLNGWDVTLG